MLIPVADLVREHGLTDVGGVLHLGAHFGEEADAYDTDMPWRGEPLVIWVEGDPAHLPRLAEHVAHRPGHRVVAALVDAREHDVTFHLASNEGASSSVLAFGTHAVEHPHITYVGERQARTTTVDALARLDPVTWGRVDFVTLDLQGLELRALQGARDLMGHVRYVFSEVNRAPLYVGCPLVEEIDAYLIGFERVATAWTEWGWGDAFWIRR